MKNWLIGLFQKATPTLTHPAWIKEYSARLEGEMLHIHVYPPPDPDFTDYHLIASL